MRENLNETAKNLLEGIEDKFPTFDYGVLPEAILDALTENVTAQQITRVLRDWDFSKDFSVTKIQIISGKIAKVTIKTPKGEMKFSVSVKEI